MPVGLWGELIRIALVFSVNGGLDLVKVEVKIIFGIHKFHDAIVVPYVEHEFHKERARHDDFISRIED